MTSTTKTGIVLQPRRVFVRSTGALGFVFAVPSLLLGCDTTDDDASEPTSQNPVNDEWEDTAAMLEMQGAGLYTAADELDQPGKGEAHVPMVTLRGTTVTMTTIHEMTDEHWITHQWLRDAGDVIFAWKAYDIATDRDPTGTFELPEGTTEFTAYQNCNLHYVWRG